MAKKTAPKPAAPSSARAGTVTDEAKIWAFIGVLLTIIGYILILLTKKGDEYAQYYGKQGLVLGIAGIIIQIVSMVLSWSFLGWLINLVWLVWLILWVIGMVYAFSGERKAIPIVGDFASKF